MDFNAILLAVAALGGLGIFFGIILTFADKVFHVPVDERTALVREALSGANCGACGYAGCDAYSEAVVSGEADISLCTPGGQKTLDALAHIMQKDSGETVPTVARVMCQGGREVVKQRAEYTGLQTCASAVSYSGGPTQCSWGCVGLGDCVRVCRFGAMKIENDLVIIDENKCTACGMCEKECPRSVIKLVPKDSKYIVRCQNIAAPRDARDVCDKACIGCKRCEKACEFDAIHVVNNCAVIDPEKCTRCGKCFEVCPVKCIEQLT